MGTPAKLKFDPSGLPAPVALAASEVAQRIQRGHTGEELLKQLADLGRLREEELTDQRSSGAVFTPYNVAEELVDRVEIGPGDTVCDPSVGPGVFLLAAAERKFQSGESVPSITQNLRGIDIDPVSVAVARSTLQLWAAWRGDHWPTMDSIVEGDALTQTPREWYGNCDAVVGNPPFLGQFKSDTARDKRRSAVLKEHFGPRYNGYIDESMLFVLLGIELGHKKSRIALIIPTSVLGSDSSQAAREWIDKTLPPKALWLGGRSIFDTATVDVSAPILGGSRRSYCEVLRYRSEKTLQIARPPDGQWASLLAAANGTPRVQLTGRHTLSDAADISADFRDAYYWLAKRVTEGEVADSRPRLATVGLIDPFQYMYGELEIRFAKQRFRRPVIEIEDQPPRPLANWLLRRSNPKVLVATQTRVIECYADQRGDVLPSTPLITITPTDRTRLWHLLAAVASPAASAWAVTAAAGTGLSQETVRLRASLLAELPLPAPSKGWDEGAELARQIQSSGRNPDTITQFGEVMNRAYNTPSDELLHWWTQRIQKKRP